MVKIVSIGCLEGRQRVMDLYSEALAVQELEHFDPPKIEKRRTKDREKVKRRKKRRQA